MSNAVTITGSAKAGGFVDNARALPTTPPVPQQRPRRTFDSSYKADIFTRSRQSRLTGGAAMATTKRPYRPHPAAVRLRDLARAGTISRLADEMRKRLGRDPSDQEIASILARSVEAISRLRALIR